MQRLERVHLVQFFLFPAQTLEFDATTAIIAPNGAGKSALLDALQIVLLGGDRSRIRFNAQAGGAHRARTIRDYCLGVFRSGDEGRARKTATTYISLVFRDEATGQALTAGIALGASIDEPDHRMHGLYLLPGVALDLDDHLERIGGKELPLEWPAFRELAARRCKAASTGVEIHAASDRFIKDLLLRLRPGPTTFIDPNAYRKAFQNALNLQRQDDIDLFVRNFVAEDRPTDIARFRSLLEGFRSIREKIEQVVRRIEAAETVAHVYEQVAGHALRAASYRALAAEYERDLLAEQVETAGEKLAAAMRSVEATERGLRQLRSERDAVREQHAAALARLQGSRGYGEQAQIDELAGRDRDRLVQLKKLLLQDIGFARDRVVQLGKLGLPTVDATQLQTAEHRWQALFDALSSRAGDASLPWSAEQLHASVRDALAATAPLIGIVDACALETHNAHERAQQRLRTARQNLARLDAGQAELGEDAMRLMSYLQDEGIAARPVCDLVRVRDATWQPAIEAYLRSNVEALLVPAVDEERAVRLYRSLQGGRAVYGVKLALSSQARDGRGAGTPAADSVAALLEGDNDAALAFLRRQLGELRCVSTEAELVRSRQGLTSDGLLARGGSIERLRLPAATQLKIGATDNRSRARVLREDIDAAERELREIKPRHERVEDCRRGLARLALQDEVAGALHDHALDHQNAELRYRATQDSRAAAADPDLLRIGEQVRDLQEGLAALDARVESQIRAEAVARKEAENAGHTLQVLKEMEEAVARRAVDASRHPDVDAARVESAREEIDSKFDSIEERRKRSEERARSNDESLARLVPDAWGKLTQYARDYNLTPEFASDQWRPARLLLQRDIDHLRGTELVNYQREADTAYATAVETFRANVVSVLHDNFYRLKHQLATLNRTLRRSPPFSNNERYQFQHEVVPEFRDLHRFIQRVTDVGGEDNLFGSAGEVPEAFRALIEDQAGVRGATPSPLDDYRRFFRFEVEVRQDERVIGTLSERMRSGSGGEHRAPLYVIAGAALAAAYGKSEADTGGLGLILLDEFGDKIDAQNARATTNYLRSLGLQLVLAAPDTAQGTLSGVLDSYIELFRDGDLLQVEHVEVTEAGRALLQSDQFDLHPELLAQETQRIEHERGLP